MIDSNCDKIYQYVLLVIRCWLANLDFFNAYKGDYNARNQKYVECFFILI